MELVRSDFGLWVAGAGEWLLGSGAFRLEGTRSPVFSGPPSEEGGASDSDFNSQDPSALMRIAFAPSSRFVRASSARTS